MVKRLMSLVLVLVLGAAALIGGLVASLGFDGAVALVTGKEPPATEMAADKDGHGDDAGQETADAMQPEPEHSDGSVTVTPFKEIIVNISATTATRRQTTRCLKLNTALVYDNKIPGAEHVEERKVYLRDSFQDYLRQLSERDVQGTAGLTILKAELLRRARAVSGSQAPQDILISDLIVQ